MWTKLTPAVIANKFDLNRLAKKDRGGEKKSQTSKNDKEPDPMALGYAPMSDLDFGEEYFGENESENEFEDNLAGNANATMSWTDISSSDDEQLVHQRQGGGLEKSPVNNEARIVCRDAYNLPQHIFDCQTDNGIRTSINDSIKDKTCTLDQKNSTREGTISIASNTPRQFIRKITNVTPSRQSSICNAENKIGGGSSSSAGKFTPATPTRRAIGSKFTLRTPNSSSLKKVPQRPLAHELSTSTPIRACSTTDTSVSSDDSLKRQMTRMDFRSVCENHNDDNCHRNVAPDAACMMKDVEKMRRHRQEENYKHIAKVHPRPDYRQYPQALPAEMKMTENVPLHQHQEQHRPPPPHQRASPIQRTLQRSVVPASKAQSLAPSPTATTKSPIKKDKNKNKKPTVPGTWYYSSNHILINEQRAHRNLPTLRRSAVLDTEARIAAERMAECNSLFHSDMDALSHTLRIEIRPGEHITILGENVGCGLSIREVHHKFMKNALDRENILGKRFVEMGIGTAKWIPSKSSPARSSAGSDSGCSVDSSKRNGGKLEERERLFVCQLFKG